MERTKKDEVRLAVARHAAELFWKHGFDKTSGDAIAAAAGLSKRTVWRYFRSKEACVEPLFSRAGSRFLEMLRSWPRNVSIETHLHSALSSMSESEQDLLDGIAVARLISVLRSEPPIRSAYLMASVRAEDELAEIIADRIDRVSEDIEVRICAAAAMAAVRVVDEDICTAAFRLGHHFEHSEVCDRMAAAMRSAASMPICDPIETADLEPVLRAQERSDALS